MKGFVEGQLAESEALEWGRDGEMKRKLFPFSEQDKSAVTDHTRKAIDLDMYSIMASYVL
jgi:hypothetical protein